jgi:hypothetical protein
MNIHDKTKPLVLNGVIISYANGIQAIRTDSTEDGKKFIHCLGHTLIRCPYKNMTCRISTMSARPCEHVKEGVSVKVEYVVVRDGKGMAVGAEWRGRLA